MKTELFEELKKQGDPRMSGKGDQFDKYLNATPSKRDYYERMMKARRRKSKNK